MGTSWTSMEQCWFVAIRSARRQRGDGGRAGSAHLSPCGTYWRENQSPAGSSMSWSRQRLFAGLGTARSHTCYSAKGGQSLRTRWQRRATSKPSHLPRARRQVSGETARHEPQCARDGVLFRTADAQRLAWLTLRYPLTIRGQLDILKSALAGRDRMRFDQLKRRELFVAFLSPSNRHFLH